MGTHDLALINYRSHKYYMETKTQDPKNQLEEHGKYSKQPRLADFQHFLTIRWC